MEKLSPRKKQVLKEMYKDKLTFFGYYDLLQRMTINGLVDLRGVKMTNEQMDELREYIAHNEVWRLIINRLDGDGLTIVDNINDSNVLT